MPSGLKLLDELFARHAGGLRAFFRRRTRVGYDVDDLTQEVYLRMLRVHESEVIRNPEAYLYTVASHLVQEHALTERRRAAAVDIADPVIAHTLAVVSQLEDDTDREARIRRLREVLQQLPPNAHAALIMAYHREMPYEAIATELGVSVSMVKKYVRQSLTHCRKRMARFG